MKIMKQICFFIFLLWSMLGSIMAQDSIIKNKTLIYKFKIMEEIAPPIWRQTQQAFAEAEQQNADIILIHMNTYGGMLDAADSIRTKVLNSKIPVWVFIDNNAASAGALISIACDSIYMRPGGNIGAATVVNQSGEQVPDKYQSYMRSMMRSTAKENNRNPIIAEAMVDDRVVIEGVTDSGKVLTFTPDEAIKNGFCEGKYNSIDELLKKNNVTNYEIKEYKKSLLESIIGFLVTPYVSGLLIMIIIGGIYFELQTPGIGFPIAASALAAILYFAPLYLEGLVEHWEVLVFVSGVLLMMVEIFVLPGFGIAGILGLAFMLTGLTISLVPNDGLDFSRVPYNVIIKALLVTLFSFGTSIIFSVYLGSKLVTSNSNIFNNLVLKAKESKSEGYVSIDAQTISLVGKYGITHTDLRPSGKIKVEDEYYDAISETGYIEKGKEVKIIRHSAVQVYVMENNNS